MSYSTDIDVVDLAGAGITAVVGKLWQYYRTVNPDGTSSPTQFEIEQHEITPDMYKVGKTVTGFPTFTLSFVQGPTPTANLIGLSVQQATREPSGIGWWLRYAGGTQLVPGNFEIVVLPEQQISQNDLNSSLPKLPLPVNSNTTINHLIATLDSTGTINVVAEGVNTSIGDAIFQLIWAFSVSPSSDVSNAPPSIFRIEPVGQPTLTVVTNDSFRSILLQLLLAFFEHNLFPQILLNLNAIINEEVISKIGGTLGTGSSLPDGVIASCSYVAPTSVPTLKIGLALSGFGGVLNKIPKAGPTGSGCTTAFLAPFLGIR